MKVLIAFLFCLTCASAPAQDPWKNIYSQHAWAQRDKWQRSEELIRLLKVGDGSRVADVGCHEGYMTFKLARVVGEDGTVYAVDLQQAKLDKVKKRADDNSISQIKTVKAADDNPNLPENELDGVVILDTYHEMDAHTEILPRIRSSLKKGGRLLICEPIADARRKLSREEQEKKHELEMEFALADLKEAGFRIVYQKDNFIDRTKEKGDRMWVVVAEKI
jgi:ubiquinone/menaquinone biosynthesis C-methylase UbiE